MIVIGIILNIILLIICAYVKGRSDAFKTATRWLRQVREGKEIK